MKEALTFIDLFSGAGGLSEGFVQRGFKPVAHVELDKAACFTLKTRATFHYLKEIGEEKLYHSYLKGEITREQLYASVPTKLLDTVINAEIGKDNQPIFKAISKVFKKRTVDLIIGGPPCQAYSIVGRASLKHKKSDERTKLYIQYGRFLKRYRPKIFVFENVPGLLSSSNGRYFKNLQKYYKRLGYTVEAKSLNASDYGVVQHRERVIIIGWKKCLDLTYPRICKVRKQYTRDDIFKDLPPIPINSTKKLSLYHTETNKYLERTGIRNGIDFTSQHITRPHNKKDLEIYKLAITLMELGQRIKNDKIPEILRTQKNITSFLDRFKVVDKKPHTMIAHIAKDGHHFIHPDASQVRSISVREAARIQSFPDDYYFEGFKESQPRSAAFRQIGNAVPPLMASKIASAIKKILK